VGHEDFRNLIIDCTIAINRWQSHPEEGVSPQTLYFKGSFLLSFLILLPLSLQNHSQGNRLSSALGRMQLAGARSMGPSERTMGNKSICYLNIHACSKACRLCVGSNPVDTQS
jgi:hypothetical protein